MTMSKIEGQVNETELRKAIEQLAPTNSLFEVRIIGKKVKSISGYFRDADTLLKELEKVDLRNTNVYITLGHLDPSIFSRDQSEHFVAGANTTSDNDVKGYRWLFIDMDPVRPSGISSSDEELQAAFDLAKRVGKFMADLGFEDPVKAMSGNGAHLLYRISLNKTKENEELIEKCLKALSMLFDTDQVKVDTANFNPSRICKLYGTLAQKGSNTPERPFRMSRIFGEVKEVHVTDQGFLEKLAAMLPQEEPQRPCYQNNYGADEFDVEGWLSQHGLSYRKADYKDGTKYVLDHCPFNPEHKAPDSMVTRSASGALGFKCLHNSCSGYHWKDLRLKFEPDAYEHNDGDRRIEEGWVKHNRDKAKKQAEENATVTAEEKLPLFQTAKMIIQRETPDPEYIKTGITKIDREMIGLEKGKLTVLTGLRASGKSTILGQIMLNAVNAGHTVLCYSGELSDKSFINWMLRQAAGKKHVQISASNEKFCYVNDEDTQKIAAWMEGRFWLYNNVRYQNSQQFVAEMQAQCQKVIADMIIIDNLMALNLGHETNSSEYKAQTEFMWMLKRLAEKNNVHIILVAHPRKANGFLRLDDISGTGNISNIIDNAFIIHRVNTDFMRYSKETFGWKDDHWLYECQCTNVIEIAKDRERGTCDLFVDLYIELETKRLKNYKSENIIYGWQEDEDGFVFVDEDDDEFKEVPFG